MMRVPCLVLGVAFVGAIVPNTVSMGDASNSASMRSLHSEEAAAQNLDLEVAIRGGEQCSRCCVSEAYHMDEAKFNMYCAYKFPGAKLRYMMSWRDKCGLTDVCSGCSECTLQPPSVTDAVSERDGFQLQL